MFTTLLLAASLASPAAPIQAPPVGRSVASRPMQAPPLRMARALPQAPAVVPDSEAASRPLPKAERCCSDQCTCGCVATGVCTCQASRVVQSAPQPLTLPAAQPVFQPAFQAQPAFRQSFMSPFQGFSRGGASSCAGGNCR